MVVWVGSRLVIVTLGGHGELTATTASVKLE